MEIINRVSNVFQRTAGGRGSGFDPKKFHQLCDNKGATLTIIRSGGYVFGGFNPNSWQSAAGQPVADLTNTAFLFSIKSPSGGPPKRFECLNFANATTPHSSHGPSFSSDLTLTGLAQRSGTTCRATYNVTACSEFTGSCAFKYDEVEVHSLDINTLPSSVISPQSPQQQPQSSFGSASADPFGFG